MNTAAIMISSGSDLVPKRCLRIKQDDDDDDKFYSRLLSKESSAANPSFRVYYGVATGAVPFLWESQPGTPKHTSSSTAMPPLNPPPAYFSSPCRSNSSCKKPSKPSFIQTILPMLPHKKYPMMSPSSSVSLSSLSVSSSSSSSRSSNRRSLSYVSSRTDDDEICADGSPTSTLCFGGRQRAAASFRGCHPIVPLKNIFA